MQKIRCTLLREEKTEKDHFRELRYENMREGKPVTFGGKGRRQSLFSCYPQPRSFAFSYNLQLELASAIVLLEERRTVNG
ncbi:MAG TPA: hypothetical protein DIT26_04575 [Mesotoga infera]|jgi:hypothetical protein|uniref:Uncharacterized protein n=1 Tax=Mesotoga infera TaxID=1236046 RepID=A0A3D3TMB3_9BACT|nr:hypothetical protein [Mesotoga infera]